MELCSIGLSCNNKTVITIRYFNSMNVEDSAFMHGVDPGSLLVLSGMSGSTCVAPNIIGNCKPHHDDNVDTLRGEVPTTCTTATTAV